MPGWMPVHVGSGAALDDRAKALADAINKTGVQSVVNPCTAVAWYGTSALLALAGDYVVGGEIAPAVKEMTVKYWPTIYRWLTVQSATAYPVIRFLRNVASNVSQGCDAMQ